MKKKDRIKQAAATDSGDKGAASAPEGLGSLTRAGVVKAIIAGILVIICGFVVLSKADPLGRNWAARLAPFLILGGYALVGLGIYLPAGPSD